MKSSSISTSNSKLLVVMTRAKFLSDRLLLDPSRPWVFTEVASLIVDLADLIGNLSDPCSKVEMLESRLNSLEMRYSELLYSLSSK